MTIRPRNQAGPHDYAVDASGELATILNPVVGERAIVLADNSTWHYTGTAWIQTAGGGAGAGHTIQDDDSNMTARANLSFQDGFVVTDDAGGNQTELDLSYGAAGYPQNVATAEADGTALTVARSDHVHALDNAVVTYAKMQDVSATDRILGRDTAGAGDVEEITPAALAAMLSATALSGVPALVRKTSDELLASSTTLQDDDALTFAVAANETWFVETWLMITSNTAADFKCGWSGPALATLTWGEASGVASDHAGFGLRPVATNPIALAAIGDTLSFGMAAGSAVCGLTLAGWLVNAGTAGSLVFRWAQNTSDVVNTTVKANSFLRLTRMA